MAGLMPDEIDARFLAALRPEAPAQPTPGVWGTWDGDGPFSVLAEDRTVAQAAEVLAATGVTSGGEYVVVADDGPQPRRSRVWDCEYDGPQPCGVAGCRHAHRETVYVFHLVDAPTPETAPEAPVPTPAARPTTNCALEALDRVIESWTLSSVDCPGHDDWTRTHNEVLRYCVAELDALSKAEHAREDEALERLAVSLRLHEAMHPEAPAPPTARPTVVCLCGSTRFMDAFHEANRRESLAGRIVLTVEIARSEDDAEHNNTEPERKRRLDELHKRKIDLSDEILVLNVGGYIGASTRSEWEYAVARGKRVRWLEPEAPVVSVAPSASQPAPDAGTDGLRAMVRQLFRQRFLGWEIYFSASFDPILDAAVGAVVRAIGGRGVALAAAFEDMYNRVLNATEHPVDTCGCRTCNALLSAEAALALQPGPAEAAVRRLVEVTHGLRELLPAGPVRDAADAALAPFGEGGEQG